MFKQKIFNVINYEDLNILIKNTYQLKFFDLLELTDWYGTDSYGCSAYHNIFIQKKELNEEKKKEFIKLLNDGLCNIDLNSILQDMCNRDIIPEGDCLIKTYDNG